MSGDDFDSLMTTLDPPLVVVTVADDRLRGARPIRSQYQGPFTLLRLSDVAHLDAGHDATDRPTPTTTRVPENEGDDQGVGPPS